MQTIAAAAAAVFDVVFFFSSSFLHYNNNQNYYYYYFFFFFCCGKVTLSVSLVFGPPTNKFSVFGDFVGGLTDRIPRNRINALASEGGDWRYHLSDSQSSFSSKRYLVSYVNTFHQTSLYRTPKRHIVEKTTIQ